MNEEESWAEFFAPQLDGRTRASLNAAVTASPVREAWLGVDVPASVRKTWRFGGLTMPWTRRLGVASVTRARGHVGWVDVGACISALLAEELTPVQ